MPLCEMRLVRAGLLSRKLRDIQEGYSTATYVICVLNVCVLLTLRTRLRASLTHEAAVPLTLARLRPSDAVGSSLVGAWLAQGAGKRSYLAGCARLPVPRWDAVMGLP